MDYYVLGEGEVRYGPVDADVLKIWVADGRILPNTRLKNTQSGEVIFAKDVPGLFGKQEIALDRDSPEKPANLNSLFEKQSAKLPDNRSFWAVVFWCVLALTLNFSVGRAGILIAGFTLFDAVRLITRKHPLGYLALGISIFTFVVILAGFMGIYPSKNNT